MFPGWKWVHTIISGGADISEVLGCHLLNFLPNLLHAKMAIALLNQSQLKAINETCLKHCYRVKGFFIFMAMLSFKQVKSNYGKKEPCEQGCCLIIKFFQCLNFGYQEYGMIIFST